ncbi:hypothetical protein TVAG_019340 [Trichomonas vaginalis G3]|uniref:Sulfatase N-terminal domain-containing protein n=1 Tax=Trichomonas vaginalis (strain ATCC PRA-98 / G3) TaxID=412133 RepID=A2DX07_TRIV3|nr:sulfatase family [Trichomonas vaginalis G3]EAY15034.1 hypothetical protein TVAG_019340 [Trichomonas vaginalis G3]KAI5549575.1 sulfatase family [Trichomonas vaginalis G3]|eukprot:XP_001327257.1 hypothetical protein [Trichomonas vaginalis G3]
MTEPTWIPHLQDLLIDKNNTYFTPSKNGSFGGGQLIFRTRFTLFATFGMVCSAPHISAKFHRAGPEDFYPKMECIGDILKRHGYSTSVIFGASFYDWNMGYTFSKHHYDKIISDVQMKHRGWVKDFVVIDHFKKELARLNSLKKPFFAHMLTLDSHQPGLVCKYCPKANSSNERAVRCTDKQIFDFLEWAKTQPWYNNTLIVMYGDHLNRWPKFRTESEKIGYKRSTYNVWINSAVKPKIQTGRMYSNFDIQPSIYAAAGFKVKGDRIALGTNLFSDKETLMEKLGFDKFEDEIEDTPKWYHSVYDGIQYQSNSNDLVVTGTLGEKDTRGEKKERDYWTNPLVQKSKKPKK